MNEKIEKQVETAFNKIINELDLEFGYEGLKEDVLNILEPLKKDIAVLLNENSELKKQLSDTKTQLINLQINDDALIKEKYRLDDENHTFREFIKMVDKLSVSMTYVWCCDSFVDYNQKIKSLNLKCEQLNHTQFHFLKNVLRKVW